MNIEFSILRIAGSASLTFLFLVAVANLLFPVPRKKKETMEFIRSGNNLIRVESKNVYPGEESHTYRPPSK